MCYTRSIEIDMQYHYYLVHAGCDGWRVPLLRPQRH